MLKNETVKDDKTLKVFFREEYSEPSESSKVLFAKTFYMFKFNWVLNTSLYFEIRAITLKKVQVASAAFLRCSLKKI